MIYNIYGADYNLLKENNKDIKCFDWFYPLFTSQSWESETFEVFEHAKRSDGIAIDIGSWIGATTIWLSKNYKEVIAIEADKIAYAALEKNLKESGCYNVNTINRPIYSTNTKVLFGVNQHVQLFAEEGLGSSTSQIKQATTDSTDSGQMTVTLHDLQSLVDLEAVCFVKVDIEGGEEFILEDLFKYAKRFKWKLLISFHYDWWSDKNIDRFNELFAELQIVRSVPLLDGDIRVEDVANYIVKNPFSSLYFEFL